MADIKQFEFNPGAIKTIRDYHRGRNWPVAYVISQDDSQPTIIYVGKTSHAHQRLKNHLADGQKTSLKLVHIITDYDFNASAAEDLESYLIQYMSGHRSFKLLNKNKGLTNLDYFDKQRYRARFPTIWQRLKELKLVNQTPEEIENSDLFKYSPFKALTDDQKAIAQAISDSFNGPDQFQTHLIKGQPGSGKTVLATYLLKLLKDEQPDLVVGLVITNRRLRQAVKAVFGQIINLKKNMVLVPGKAMISKSYDVLVVDEAHLLKRRPNPRQITNFNQINRTLKLAPDSNQLDWIRQISKKQILLYDPKQTIRPENIQPQTIKSLPATKHYLNNQVRIKAGNDYVNYIDSILNDRQPARLAFGNYQLRLLDDIKDLIKIIEDRQRHHGPARLLAGWAWRWTIDDDQQVGQIKINRQVSLAFQPYEDTTDVSSTDQSIDIKRQVISIHGIQGFELNYAGVIIGPDLAYDNHTCQIIIDKQNYYDHVGKRGLKDDRELAVYIKNIYRVLLTRAIHGTYLYVVDQKLKQHLKQFF